MNNQATLFRLTVGSLARPTLIIQQRTIYREKLDLTTVSLRGVDLLEDPVWKKIKSWSRAKTRLDSVLSGMKTMAKKPINQLFKSHGNSDMFNYATNPSFDKDELKVVELKVWRKFSENAIKSSHMRLPNNGFEEMIHLTEQGKLWKFPIDNEQGMEAEQQVPFEDHVFLDSLIDDRFPKNDYIRNFMDNITTGLARNHWITAQRKRDIITFYAEYFSERRDLYSKSGVDLDYPDPSSLEIASRSDKKSTKSSE